MKNFERVQKIQRNEKWTKCPNGKACWTWVHDSGAGPNNVQRVLIQKKIRRRAKRDGEKQKKVSFNWTVKLPLIVRRVSAAGAQINWAIAGAFAPSITIFIPPHFVTVSNFKCMKCLSKQVSRRKCANLFQTGQLSMTPAGRRVGRDAHPAHGKLSNSITRLCHYRQQ